MQVSYGTTSASLSNTTVYRNYFRANPPSTTLAPALLALMNQFSWKRVGLLTQDENRFRRVGIVVLVASTCHSVNFKVCLCIHAVANSLDRGKIATPFRKFHPIPHQINVGNRMSCFGKQM
jgi:hypothetical protein